MDAVLRAHAVDEDMWLVDMHLSESQRRRHRPHKLATLAQDFLGCAVIIALVRDHGDRVQIAQHLGEDQWRNLRQRQAVLLSSTIAVESERPECERARD